MGNRESSPDANYGWLQAWYESLAHVSCTALNTPSALFGGSLCWPPSSLPSVAFVQRWTSLATCAGPASLQLPQHSVPRAPRVPYRRSPSSRGEPPRNNQVLLFRWLSDDKHCQSVFHIQRQCRVVFNIRKKREPHPARVYVAVVLTVSSVSGSEWCDCHLKPSGALSTSDVATSICTSPVL